MGSTIYILYIYIIYIYIYIYTETTILIQLNMEKKYLMLLICAYLLTMASPTSSTPVESSQRVRRQDIPNGCDPATEVGGFLIFPLLRAWCEEQGVTDFGVYGR